VARYAIPTGLIDQFGPFAEFKKDGAIVSVELADGRIVEQVLLVYPNEVWAVRGSKDITFDPTNVVRVFQSPADLATRTTSEWVFFGASNAT
jgi:hypothetical protein